MRPSQPRWPSNFSSPEDFASDVERRGRHHLPRTHRDRRAAAEQVVRGLPVDDVGMVERGRPELGSLQPRDDVVVAEVRGVPLRGVAAAVGAVSGEKLDAREVAAGGGVLHRRQPAVGTRVDRRALREDRARARLVAVAARGEQRRDPLVVGSVDVGLRRDQPIHAVEVAGVARDEDGGETGEFRLVDVSAGAEEEVEDVDVAVLRRGRGRRRGA